MHRALRLFAIAILIAVLPLRAVAGVTIGFSASGHHDLAGAHGVAYGHGGEAHAPHGDAAPANPVESSCNLCAEHCSSGPIAISAAPAAETPRVGRERTILAERSAPLYVPDQLDRPPLA